MILHVTRPHKRTKDVVARRVFERPNAFSGRAPTGPAGELEQSSRLPSRNRGRGGVQLLREKGGKRRERKREMGGKERGRKDRERRQGRGCLLFI